MAPFGAIRPILVQVARTRCGYHVSLLTLSMKTCFSPTPLILLKTSASMQSSLRLVDIRPYTNFAKPQWRKNTRPEPFDGYWKILNIIMFSLGAVLLLNWNYFRYLWPSVPELVPNEDERLNKETLENDVYTYGEENLPLSYRLANKLMNRKVEAAELHPASASRIAATVHDEKDAISEASMQSTEHLDPDEKKKSGFRDRKITEYENRIRTYSTPDKVFRLFATLKIQDPDGDGYGIYMTPDDFIRAITPGVRQPDGLGLDQFKLFDPARDKIETNIPEDSIFHKMGERGLISFSDYLFLMTILAIGIVVSARHIEIAFKIFDVNGDGTVDSEEFEEILNVLRSQTSVGIRHREAKMMGGASKFVDSGLKTFFFGKSGTGKLKVQDFLAFQAKMKDEVLKMEFDRMDPVDGKISERTFAKMLLTYAGISEQKQKRMLKRVKDRFQGEASKGLDFKEVESFSQVFRHLNDIDTALGFYHAAGGSIDHHTLQRVVKTVAKADLDDHVLDVVFTLFDDNEDGKLSQREFISIMKARQMRGMERPKDMGVTRLLGAVWKCAKEEVQGSRHA